MKSDKNLKFTKNNLRNSRRKWVHKTLSKSQKSLLKNIKTTSINTISSTRCTRSMKTQIYNSLSYCKRKGNFLRNCRLKSPLAKLRKFMNLETKSRRLTGKKIKSKKTCYCTTRSHWNSKSISDST